MKELRAIEYVICILSFEKTKVRGRTAIASTDDVQGSVLKPRIPGEAAAIKRLNFKALIADWQHVLGAL